MAEAIPLVSPLLSSIFGKKDKQPEAKVAPTPDDEMQRRMKARKMQRTYADTGRAGTSLQDKNSTLG